MHKTDKTVIKYIFWYIYIVTKERSTEHLQNLVLDYMTLNDESLVYMSGVIDKPDTLNLVLQYI